MSTLTSYVRRCFLFLGLFGFAASSHGESVDLHLLGRSEVDGYSVSLTKPDWKWLREKGTLILGTSAPDYAPFDISEGSQEFEGLTADYAGLISQLLHVKIKVRRFDSRDEVITALKSGEVDLLGAANAFEAADNQVALSSGYAVDTPVLVTRVGDKLPRKASGQSLQMAMLYHYQPPSVVHAAYPESHLQLYASTLGAIGAVAFGQADVYLGDSISTNYLIGQNYLNNVQLKDFSTLEEQVFAFAINHENTQLLRVINEALAVVPSEERFAILSRWGANGLHFEGQSQLSFAGNEQLWIDKHPRLKVAIIDGFLPFSFFDDRNKFSGISADLLDKISLRTGLKFDVVRFGSVRELVEAVKHGDADLVAAFTPSISRENDLRFTKPYLTTPYVLITKAVTGNPKTLDDFYGKRVALVANNTLHHYLTDRYPGVQLVEAENSAQAQAMVTNGEVDGAINPLATAKYLINQQSPAKLQIDSTVGVEAARISFAVGRGELELYSILSKALTSIAPEEMDDLSNRWRSAVVLDNRYWVRHRDTIVKVSAVGILVLLTSVGWIIYLRQLIRRRYLAERALTGQMSFMRALIDGTPHPIYVRDRDGRLLMCNEGYLDIFGVDRALVLGKTLLESKLTNTAQARTYHEDYLTVMRDGRSKVCDRLLSLSCGQELTIYHWMLPYRDADDTVVGMIGGWIDISERQRLLDQLQEAKSHADGASRAKTEFLTTMSHEIRTPMNAVIGMLELALKKAERGVADKASIAVASGAARGLLDLIGDILDIAHIESGRLTLNQRRTNLMDLIESTARVFEAMAQQKGLLMSLEVDSGLNCDVLVDPSRLRQIISNLLSNAIKFTEAGQVRLKARVESSLMDGRLKICLRVEDTGIGISGDDQQKLFSPFTQASNQHQVVGTSSGLGLMISRRLCEMMGGTLKLESRLGEGTKIELHFDMVALFPLATQTTLSEPRLLGRKLNILVVDDYPANRLLLAQQLVYLGHKVTDAKDGLEGLVQWRAQRFDAVITDCNMPVMNGYELARALRREEAINGISPVLIVGFTANAQTGELERCLAAGMNDCLFKPISLENLEARLTSIDLSPITLEPDGEVPPPRAEAVIDIDALRRLTNGDKSSIRHLLSTLALSLEDDMSKLVVSFTQRDLPALCDIAHRVKSGARVIRAHRLAQCCENLEQACLRSNTDGLAQQVDEMHDAMEQTLEIIDAYEA